MNDEKRWGVWFWLLLTALFFSACSNPNPDGLEAQLADNPNVAAETPTEAQPAPTELDEPVEPTVTSYPDPESESVESNCVPPSLPYPSPQAAYPAPNETTTIPNYTYEIINNYPHDPDAFTQGLVWENGMFYEGTGLYGRSSLRHVNSETGEVQQIIPIDETYFGEGIVVWENRIIQITWQNQTAFVYDKATFEQIGTFNYIGEGWGITHDGSCLIMSNGTNIISFRDPETFTEMGQIRVFDNNGPVMRLNELEYIDGEIFANVWPTNRIVRIDPQTGQVVGNVDLTNLLDMSALTQPVDVLNGIAYDAENGRIFVTGKLWPTLFEIELIEQ